MRVPTAVHRRTPAPAWSAPLGGQQDTGLVLVVRLRGLYPESPACGLLKRLACWLWWPVLISGFQFLRIAARYICV